MGWETALNKIALPITTLNSALRFASSVKRTAFYCVQCEKNRIVECAFCASVNGVDSAVRFAPLRFASVCSVNRVLHVG